MEQKGTYTQSSQGDVWFLLPVGFEGFLIFVYVDDLLPLQDDTKIGER